MRKYMTMAQALALGYVVDRHVYPHYAYREKARWFGKDYVFVYTDLEEQLINSLRQVTEALQMENPLAHEYVMATANALLKDIQEGEDEH